MRHEVATRDPNKTVKRTDLSEDILTLQDLEVLKAVSMKMAVFWVVAPCSLV
jgi:hypothetical protein